MIGRWLRREAEQGAAHWREDARRGFAFGLAVAGPVLTRLSHR